MVQLARRVRQTLTQLGGGNLITTSGVKKLILDNFGAKFRRGTSIEAVLIPKQPKGDEEVYVEVVTQSYTGKYKTEQFAVDNKGYIRDTKLGSRGSYNTLDEAKSFAEFGSSIYKPKGKWA